MNNQKNLHSKVAATSFFALFLNYTGIGLVFPLFPQLCYDPSLNFLSPTASETERSVILGILLCLMPLTQFFFSPLLGSLSDRYGRRSLLVKSLAIGIVGYFMGAYAVSHSSLPLLFLSRIIVGISTSNSSVVAASLADISTKEERASQFSLYGTSTGAGMTVGPLLGALLSNKELCPFGSYELPFIAAGTMTLFNYLAVLFVFPEKIGQSEKRSDPPCMAPHKLLWESFCEKKLRFFFLIAFFFHFGWTFFWEFVPVTVMHTIGYPAHDIGYIYMTGAFSYVVISLLITRKLLAKVDVAVLLPLSTGLLAIFIGLLSLIQNTTHLFQLVILQQLFLSCIYPLLSAYVSLHSAADSQGKALGMLNAIKAIACSLGPLCSGIFFSFSFLGPVIIGVAALSLSSLLSIRFFGRLSNSPVTDH